ncbi:MAG TPA: hypothetical protein VN032_10060 [Thermoanaerobaculia bacterium]|nr:hypothetical protein [Thermoanaerobaculia bacterium]
MPRSRPGKRKCSQKILARARVYSAVASGRLTRPEACSACGRVGAVQGHHDDYSKPLEVTWLCVACHRARHASTRRAPDLEFAATEAIQ